MQWADELGRLVISVIVLISLVAVFDRFDEGLLYKICPSLMVAGLLICLLDVVGMLDSGAGSAVGVGQDRAAAFSEDGDEGLGAEDTAHGATYLEDWMYRCAMVARHMD